MVIGLTYNLKNGHNFDNRQDLPDDYFEEFDSKITIEAITDELEKAGNKVIPLGYDINEIIKYRPMLDLVFNICEGLGGRSREGYIPSILEYLGIPYTGADPTALNVALDKNLCKIIANQIGINTPDWWLIDDYHKNYDDIKDYPVIIKPLCEGSSKGISEKGSVVYSVKEAMNRILYIKEKYGVWSLVERYISGYDYTVGIVDDKVIGVMKIEPKSKSSDWIYSVENKRHYKELVDYVLVDKGSRLYNILSDDAIRIYHEIGCRDFGRVDFRVYDNNDVYFIEINPLAGLNPRDSDLVILGRLNGLSYSDIIMGIVNSAVKRCGITKN